MRISNGYRIVLPDGAPFTAIHEILEEFKLRARPILEDVVFKRIASTAANVIDRRTLDMPTVIDGVIVERDERPLEAATRVVLRQYHSAHEGGIPEGLIYMFDAYVVVVPAQLGTILAVLFCSNPIVRKEWESLEAVVPFQYWDDDPAPDDVTEATWMFRGDTWRGALRDRTFAAAGYTTPCFGLHGMPIPQPMDIIARLPSVRDRSYIVALTQLANRRLVKIQPKTEQEMVLVVSDLMKAVESDQKVHAEFEETADEISKLLSDITEEILF